MPGSTIEGAASAADPIAPAKGPRSVTPELFPNAVEAHAVGQSKNMIFSKTALHQCN